MTSFLFCNCSEKFISRDLSAILLNITALLVRLTQTSTVIFVFKKESYCYFTCMHYDM